MSKPFLTPIRLRDGQGVEFFDDSNTYLGTIKMSGGDLTLDKPLVITGSLSATTKSFLIEHPTKPGMTLRHGSLEGPENGVYFRGRSQSEIITLPDYWSGLVDPLSITVNLTPIGAAQSLRVKEVGCGRILVKTSLRSGKLDYFFTVFAERKDTPKLQVETEK